jgi:Cu2+-containing amine oxidase
MTVSTVRSQEKTAPARHPLAPLTVDEAGTAARAALDASGPGSRLVYCALDEPAKEAVRGWDDGGRPVPREALCVIYERPRQLTWQVTVALDETARVTNAVPAPGVFPLVTGEQFMADSERIKQAPRVPGGARPAGPD